MVSCAVRNVTAPASAQRNRNDQHDRPADVGVAQRRFDRRKEAALEPAGQIGEWPGQTVAVDPVVDLRLVAACADERLHDDDGDAEQRDEQERLAPAGHAEHGRDERAGEELPERETGVVHADREAAVLLGPPLAHECDVHRLGPTTADSHRDAQQQERDEAAREPVRERAADDADQHGDVPRPGAPVPGADPVRQPAEEQCPHDQAGEEHGVDQPGLAGVQPELLLDRGETAGRIPPSTAVIRMAPVVTASVTQDSGCARGIH